MPFLFPSEVSLGPAPNRSAASNHDPIGIRRQRDPRLPEKMTSGVRNPLGAHGVVPSDHALWDPPHQCCQIHSDRAASTSGIARSCIWPGSPMLGRAWPSYTVAGAMGQNPSATGPFAGRDGHAWPCVLTKRS
jgi:hypothetical protein